jgi:hypothetical protein
MIVAFIAARQLPAVVHHDIYHQMALMRESLRVGAIPHQELFAYTATIYPAIQHEWGAGLIALWATMIGGAAGILVLHFVLQAALLLILLSGWRRQAVRFSSVVLALTIALPLILFWLMPIVAQSYSIVGLALLLRFLIADRLGRHWTLALGLPLIVVWANIHAGFVLGIASLCAESFERMLRRERWEYPAAAAGAMTGLVLANPWGLQFYGYLYHALTMERPSIEGWNTAWLSTNLTVSGVLLIVSLAITGYVVRLNGWRESRGISGVLMLAILSLRAERIVPFYAVGWVMTVCPLLDTSKLGRKFGDLIETELGTVRVVCFAALLTCAMTLIARAPLKLMVPNDPGPLSTRSYPVGAVDYLKRSGFHGNLMTSFNSGAYVLWHLYPAVRVGCDSRHETAYTDSWVLENQLLYDGEPARWKSIAIKYPTDAFLVERRFALARTMDAQTEWRRVYVDDSYAVYARPGLHLPDSNRIGDRIVGTFP